MRHRHHRALTVAQQNRQAVGREHGANPLRDPRHRGVGLRLAIFRRDNTGRASQFEHIGTMHLAHPDRWCRQADIEQRAVAFYHLHILAGVQAEVE